MSLGTRLQHAWNAFTSDTKASQPSRQFFYGVGQNDYPGRLHFHPGNEKSIVTSVFNRIAIDVATAKFQHVRVNQNGKYDETIKDLLNDCLTVEANMDQTGRELIQDVAMTLCEEGCAIIVPVDTTLDPEKTDAYEIKSLRCGVPVEWYPDRIRVKLYNDRTGNKEEIVLFKRNVAVVTNPLYAVMNEPNSTLKRLIRKLNLLDAVDEQSGSGKLDLIIQLPYIIKSEGRRKQAEQRRKDIEMQLAGSKYGIAYTDGTEHVTQLNRPAENNLLTQVEYLTNMLYGQLGMAPSIFDGTADENVMTNYQTRTVTPMLCAIAEAMNRAFLSKTARTQGQAIQFFLDPFRFVPTTQVPEMADKLIRNEVLTPNEVRAIINYPPSDDPKSNELRNPNINQENQNGVNSSSGGLDDELDNMNSEKEE